MAGRCPGGAGSRPPASCPRTGCSWQLSSWVGGSGVGQGHPKKPRGGAGALPRAQSLPVIAPVDGVDQVPVHQAGMVLALPLPAGAAGAAGAMGWSDGEGSVPLG